jgi:outer membrane immunogenic protein
MRFPRAMICLVAAGLPAAVSAQGQPEPAPSAPPNYIAPPLLSGIKVTTDYSVGVMRGRAQEYVYQPNGATLSRLNWDFGNVSMFNARTTVQLMPWLSAGFRGAMNLTGDATLQDVDYGLGGCPASGASTYCESNHTVSLRRAYMVDAFVAARIYEAAGFSIRGIAGYQHDHYRWEAIGGKANYGELPPGYVISYQQTWGAAYLGGGVGYTRGPWSFSGRLVGSPWANGAGRDLHHVRSALFVDTTKVTTYASGELGLAYRFNPYFSVTADYRYQQWGLGKGAMSARDLITGDKTTFGEGASGASNLSHTLSVGFKVDLQPGAEHKTASIKDESNDAARPAVWRGWYLGIGTGAAIQRDRWTTGMISSPPIAPNSTTASEEIFGGTNQRATMFTGYNARTTLGMMGIEADFGRTNMSVTKTGIPGTGTAAELAAASDAINVNHELDASVRLRFGGSITDNVLAYVTGGVAFEQVSASVSCTPGYSACGGLALYDRQTHWRAGWTVGAGAEINLMRNWFARSEYRYSDFGAYNTSFFKSDAATHLPVRIDGTSHRLDVGLGTRF